MKDTLRLIKEQTGLDLQPCGHFTGIRTCRSGRYFNVELAQRLSVSEEYAVLERFANRLQLIRVEPNGLCRAAIFLGARNPKKTFKDE